MPLIYIKLNTEPAKQPQNGTQMHLFNLRSVDLCAYERECKRPQAGDSHNGEIWTINKTFEGLDYGSLTEANTPSSTDLPKWIQAAWIIVFGCMILVATGGNCIVIWIVMAHRRMRTVTNYFLVNLSIADLLLTLFNCTFNSIYMIQRNWPFGTWYCTISNFIANATVTASVFTLTGISCDRYLAIVHPLHPRMSKTSSLITIFFIWTASMVFAVPCLMYSTTFIYRHRGIEQIGCIMIWPDKKVVGSTYDLGYQMLFLVIAYFVPMLLMSMCYTIMGKVLWGSKSIGELTQRQLDSIRSKRKVVKMFILVVVIFGICWLPYHGYFIYVYFDTKVIYNKYTQHVFLSFYWFAMSNAIVNPMIYYWMNARKDKLNTTRALYNKEINADHSRLRSRPVYWLHLEVRASN
ncbi:tachykinin-like peptides receptor 86C isoform X1 [Dendroctonus ponderosae]|uniref:tachykinin-like peptides receptor 86C isoform X1 n=2 Tax=Dendroctonus ponderosae TaxID=77166 RepID=UPI002035A498|nr:tachykinin-like peptides receptor 86C isoform X1 [Dendroctonus ponderosae]